MIVIVLIQIKTIHTKIINITKYKLLSNKSITIRKLLNND